LHWHRSSASGNPYDIKQKMERDACGDDGFVEVVPLVQFDGSVQLYVSLLIEHGDCTFDGEESESSGSFENSMRRARGRTTNDTQHDEEDVR
jgi:hypothetical protein